MPKQYLGCPRSNNVKETENWTLLTDKQEKVYWDTWACDLQEALKSIITRMGGTR